MKFLALPICSRPSAAKYLRLKYKTYHLTLFLTILKNLTKISESLKLNERWFLVCVQNSIQKALLSYKAEMMLYMENKIKELQVFLYQFKNQVHITQTHDLIHLFA